jgi:hypothetical protein
MADAGSSPLSSLVQSPGPTSAPGVPTPSMPDGDGGPLAGLVKGAGAGASGAGVAPPPTHQQTVTAIRHFGELQKRLSKLLADPSVGKENMRPKIFDMAAGLLGDGFMTLPRLMNEVKTLPQDPADQKKWLQKHLEAVSRAQVSVLDHYRAGNPGSGDWRADLAAQPPEGETDHANLMDGVMKHYQRR